MPKSTRSNSKAGKIKAGKSKTAKVVKLKARPSTERSSAPRVAKKLASKPGQPVSSPASFMRRLLEKRKQQRREAEAARVQNERENSRFHQVRHVAFSKFAGPRRKAA